MRSALRIQAFVCLDCRLRQFQHLRQRFQSNVAEAQHTPKAIDLSTGLTFDASKPTKYPPSVSQSGPASKIRFSIATRSLNGALQSTIPSSPKNDFAADWGALSLPERYCLNAIAQLRQRLDAGITLIEPLQTSSSGLSFEDAINATMGIPDPQGPAKDALNLARRILAGQKFSKFMEETRLIPSQNRGVLRNILDNLGIGRQELEDLSCKIRAGLSRQRKRRPVRIRPMQMPSITKVSRVADKKSPLMSPRTDPDAATKLGRGADAEFEISAPGLKETKRYIPKLDSTKSRLLRERDVEMEPLAMDAPNVPTLSYDLSRVLFNPGVYQLQDPRSRVFNFSPYLQRILPVSEFNFDALNDYITSSKDSGLRELAVKHEKKYLGSSSSMTGVLTHFHFLLSAWRPINVKTLSQSFTDPLRSFTQFQRGPSAIFLRWQDGTYAVDADKAYDSANILMSLGKSMEKLLTLKEEDFERYRKSAQEEGAELPRPEPEVYHYTESGDFLLRSQLDAYDSRLPGTGMFDLKTRAVVSVRMNVRDHASGMGYEIQNRFGDMESYEKEYFDMIRSAFLKYSLQVRMGRMDGIFVAYHNIERIFGFQYISLPEMDLHLHGTEDQSIGDAEFKLSLGLLNEIFNKVTNKMPETSLRFHFETRDSVGAEGSYLFIFAEAQTEEDIENIQNTRKAEIADFEARIFNTSGDGGKLSIAEADTVSSSVPDDLSDDQLADETEVPDSSEPSAKDAKTANFSQPPPGKLMGLTLRLLNKVNGQAVLRPLGLDKYDSWDVEYTLEEMPHDRALVKYNQCRGRRDKLQNLTQRNDEAANYYLRKIKRLSENGKYIRKKIDRHDAGRPVVVLDRVV